MNQEIKNTLQELRCCGYKKGALTYIYDHETNKLLFALDKHNVPYFKNTPSGDFKCVLNGMWYVSTEKCRNLKELILNRLLELKQYGDLQLNAKGGTAYDEFILGVLEKDYYYNNKRMVRQQRKERASKKLDG